MSLSYCDICIICVQRYAALMKILGACQIGDLEACRDNLLESLMACDPVLTSSYAQALWDTYQWLAPRIERMKHGDGMVAIDA